MVKPIETTKASATVEVKILVEQTYDEAEKTEDEKFEQFICDGQDDDESDGHDDDGHDNDGHDDIGWK